MACKHRGAALVNVLLLLAVLLAMALTLAESVLQSTRRLAAANQREEISWAARAGIETARRQLAAAYASSSGWQNYLTATSAGSYPSTPAWMLEINGATVEVFLRDNPDGDSDEHRDNDLKIFVLARVRGKRGQEILIESLCGLEPPVPQSPQQATGANLGINGRPIRQYGIAD